MKLNLVPINYRSLTNNALCLTYPLIVCLLFFDIIRRKFDSNDCHGTLATQPSQQYLERKTYQNKIPELIDCVYTDYLYLILLQSKQNRQLFIKNSKRKKTYGKLTNVFSSSKMSVKMILIRILGKIFYFQFWASSAAKSGKTTSCTACQSVQCLLRAGRRASQQTPHLTTHQLLIYNSIQSIHKLHRRFLQCIFNIGSVLTYYSVF